jgi:hypothetical protein
MGGSRPRGVEPYSAWVPADDPGRGTGPYTSAVHRAGRSCTPAGPHDAPGNLTPPSFMLSPSRVAHLADRLGAPRATSFGLGCAIKRSHDPGRERPGNYHKTMTSSRVSG